MNQFQYRNIFDSQKSKKSVFISKREFYFTLCNDCSICKNEKLITQNRKIKLKQRGTFNKDEKIKEQTIIPKKSLKNNLKSNNMLMKTAPCSSVNIMRLQDNSSILRRNIDKMNKTQVISRNPSYLTYSSDITKTNKTISQKAPFNFVYQNPCFNINMIKSTQSKLIKTNFFNHNSLINVPMVQSINHKYFNSSGSSQNVNVSTPKKNSVQNINFNKIRFVQSVSGNLDSLTITPVKYLPIVQENEPSGFNSLNTSERMKQEKKKKDQNLLKSSSRLKLNNDCILQIDLNNDKLNVSGQQHYLRRLKSPPTLIKQQSQQFSQLSCTLKHQSKQINVVQKNIEFLSQSKEIILQMQKNDKLFQSQKQQDHQSLKHEEKGISFGRYSAQIPNKKQFSNIKVRKTISLRDQQSSQQEQSSEVIYGYRKINNLQIMEDIEQDMQESIMTRVEQNIQNSKQMKFHDF